MAAPRLQGRPLWTQQPAAATRPELTAGVPPLRDSAMAHAGARGGSGNRAPPKRALAGRSRHAAVSKDARARADAVESSSAEPQRRSATQRRELPVCPAVARCEAAAATAGAPLS
jgi:hypothetical protein